MAGIFVSYRRSDSQGEAGRLFDDLAKHFGEHSVFMDVSAIEAGRDFRKAIEEGVTKCGVLLVVMGPEWVSAKDSSGIRRLDDPGDFVRIETASALKRDIPVIPVLIRGTKMPTAEQLPDDLKELAYRNAIELTHARWRSDVQLLVEALRRLVGDTSQPATEAAAPLINAEANSAIDAETLQRVSHELAIHIGPIASLVVKRAAASCFFLDDLYLKIAEEIDSPEERAQFLQEHASSRALAFPETPKEAQVLPFVPNSTTSTGLSSRTKYVLAGSGAGILLILMFVLVPRFAQPKGVVPSTAIQSVPASVPPETQAEAVPPVSTPADSQARLSEPAEEANSKRLNVVSPVYPPLARAARIQGTVVLNVDIAKDGTVAAIQLVSGHPMLAPAAIDAVKQWRYKPFLQNGRPTAVNTRITLNFNLASK